MQQSYFNATCVSYLFACPRNLIILGVVAKGKCKKTTLSFLLVALFANKDSSFILFLAPFFFFWVTIINAFF